MVVRMNARGRGWIVTAEKPMQRRRLPGSEGGESATKIGIPCGGGRQSGKQRTQIKAGSPDQDRQDTARFEIAQHGAGERCISAGREFPARINHINQMMWDAAPLPRWRFGRSNFEAPIYLDGVVVDNFAIQRLR